MSILGAGEAPMIMDGNQRRRLSDAERVLIIALCREAGDGAEERDLIEGALSNHDADLIIAAAAGDIGALIRLRRAFGLPALV